MVSGSKADLLVEGNLLEVGLNLIGEVGLASANGSGAAKGQVVVEAVAKCAPGVEQALQAPAQICTKGIKCMHKGRKMPAKGASSVLPLHET